MVLYFTPIGAEPGKDDWKIYMGRDKYENEDLIKYGLPHDVWYALDPAVFIISSSFWKSCLWGLDDPLGSSLMNG